MLPGSQDAEWIEKCRSVEHCASKECTKPFREHFTGFESESSAVDHIKSNPEKVTSLLGFDFEEDNQLKV